MEGVDVTVIHSRFCSSVASDEVVSYWGVLNLHKFPFQVRTTVFLFLGYVPIAICHANVVPDTDNVSFEEVRYWHIVKLIQN